MPIEILFPGLSLINERASLWKKTLEILETLNTDNYYHEQCKIDTQEWLRMYMKIHHQVTSVYMHTLVQHSHE